MRAARQLLHIQRLRNPLKQQIDGTHNLMMTASPRIERAQQPALRPQQKQKMGLLQKNRRKAGQTFRRVQQGRQPAQGIQQVRIRGPDAAAFLRRSVPDGGKPGGKPRNQGVVQFQRKRQIGTLRGGVRE